MLILNQAGRFSTMEAGGPDLQQRLNGPEFLCWFSRNWIKACVRPHTARQLKTYYGDYVKTAFWPHTAKLLKRKPSQQGYRCWRQLKDIMLMLFTDTQAAPIVCFDS